MYLFLKLDMLEFCKENFEVVFLVCFGSLSMVDLLSNEDEFLEYVVNLMGVLVLMMGMFDCMVLNFYDEFYLYVEVDSLCGLLLFVVF